MNRSILTVIKNGTGKRSGGPVFDHNGMVYGVDVARLTRESPMPGKTPMIVENGVVIEIATIRGIYRRVNIG